MHKLHIKMPQEGGDHLGHLHKRNVFSKTHTTGTSKSQKVSLHFRFVAFEPAVGVKGISVGAEDFFFAVDDPGTGAYDMAGGDEAASDDSAAGRDDARQQASDGRVDA